MFIQDEPKRLHNDTVPDEPEEQPVEDTVEDIVSETSDAEESDAEEEKGDLQFINYVHFEHCPSEPDEAFCVPAQGHRKATSAKRAKDEDDIQSKDLEVFCDAMSTQEKMVGYWEIGPEVWMDGAALLVLECETLGFAVQCEEEKLVRISTRDINAMLAPCLFVDSDSPVIKKVTSTWISYVDSERVPIQWEIRGPNKAVGRQPTKSSLPQRAKSFIKRRMSGTGKEDECEMEGKGRPGLYAQCISELETKRKR